MAAINNCVLPPAIGYVRAIPEPVCPANLHGAVPNLNVTLKTFLPDGRGTNVPLNAHPREEAVNVPSVAMLSGTLVPSIEVVDQLPVTAESCAADE